MSALKNVVLCVGLLLLGSTPVVMAARDPRVQSAPPTRVRVQGTQLLVEKGLPGGRRAAPIPYVIKGITWVPAARAPRDGPDPLAPQGPPVSYGFFFDWPDRRPT